METSTGEVTRLLAELKSNPDAASEIVPLIYGQLHRLATSYMQRERPDHTLQPTLLADEACQRLLSQRGLKWENRTQFFCAAAKIMREILVDHARARQAEKRGGRLERVAFDPTVSFSPENSRELIQLNDALESLDEIDPQQAQIVDLRFFGGLTEDEIAKVLGVSARTVRRDWRVARAWLYAELSGEAEEVGEAGRSETAG